MTLRSYIKEKLKWDEPLGLNITLAMATGCFHAIAPPPSARKFFYYFSNYVLFTFVLLETFAAIHLTTSKDFFGDGIESLRLIQTGLPIIAKYMTFRCRERQFSELFERIRTAWDTYHPLNRDFLAQCHYSANVSSVLIFSFIGSTFTVNILIAHVKNIFDPEVVAFPLKVWVPPFARGSFLLGTLIQFVAYWPALMLLCNHISFLDSITSYVVALGGSLARDIRRQTEWRGEDIQQIYMKHQELMRIVKRVNELMSSNWGFEIMSSSIQLTLVSYTTFKALKRHDIGFFNEAFLLVANVVVIYLLFGCGNRIIIMGEEIHDSMYEAPWVETSVQERKNFYLMLFRTTHPTEYKYKIIHFDLPAFSKVVNTTFSYMALLQFLDDSRNDEVA